MNITNRPFKVRYKDDVATIRAGDITIQLHIKPKQMRSMYMWGSEGEGTLSISVGNQEKKS